MTDLYITDCLMCECKVKVISKDNLHIIECPECGDTETSEESVEDVIKTWNKNN